MDYATLKGYAETYVNLAPNHCMAMPTMSVEEGNLFHAIVSDLRNKIDDRVAAALERPDATSRPTKAETLERATAAVADRGAAYGTVQENFDRIARLWTAHLMNRYAPDGSSRKHLIPALDAHDVAMMNVLMKIARLEQTPSHEDSWVDVAGYAACGNNLPG